LRLSPKEIKIIQEEVNSVFKDAKVYLFGSRLDDSKKGGDIDLYIVPKEQKDFFRKKVLLKTKLEDLLYKPVDITVAYNRNRAIEKEVQKNCKLL